jgi:hypothetical protein
LVLVTVQQHSIFQTFRDIKWLDQIAQLGQLTIRLPIDQEQMTRLQSPRIPAKYTHIQLRTHRTVKLLTHKVILIRHLQPLQAAAPTRTLAQQSQATPDRLTSTQQPLHQATRKRPEQVQRHEVAQPTHMEHLFIQTTVIRIQ